MLKHQQTNKKLDMRTAVLRPQEYMPIQVTIDPPKPTAKPERDKYAEEIKVLKKYVTDLRNGKPVDNIHPKNDPYFLIPENIEDIIEGMEEIVQGQFFVVEDPSNIWECI
jgi:hypothetical protein